MSNHRPPFRLRIAHFLLLTTVCAAHYTLGDRLFHWEDVAVENRGFYKMWGGFSALLFGTAITAMLILLGRRWRHGEPMLRSPGHAILLYLTIIALLQGLITIATEIYRASADPVFVAFHAFYAWNLDRLLLCFAVGVLSCVFARLMPGNLWWKSFLALPGVVLLALVPQHVLALRGVWRPWFYSSHQFASLGVAAASLVLLTLACLSDRRHRLEHDWLHWTAVLTSVGGMLFEVYTVLYHWYWAV